MDERQFDTKAEREAAVTAELIKLGLDPNNPDNRRLFPEYKVKDGAVQPPASPVVPPAKPVRSEKQQKQSEKAAIREEGITRSSTDWAATQTEGVPEERASFNTIPYEEKRSREYPGLPPQDLTALVRQDNALIEDENARLEELKASGFDVNPEVEQRVRDEQAIRSRQLTPAGSYPSDVTYEAQPEVLPIEFSLTDPQARSFSQQWVDVTGRQTSIGVDPYAGTTGVRFEPPTIKFEGTEAEAQIQASRDALGELRTWLVSNNEAYRKAVEAGDTETMTAILYSIINSLDNPGTIKEPGVGTGTVTQAERDELGTFLPQEQQGSIPDYSPEQMVYLKSFRTSLTKSLGTEGANQILGDPQWYQDPELKRQRLAVDPEFEGMLGLGVYRYPSGATIESTPMYAMRMLAAPANFVVGLATGLIEQGMEYMHPGTGAIIQRGREQSEINPAGRSVGQPVPSPIFIALDNVKRNRGATEEIYDLGRTVAPDATNNNIARGMLFLTGLAIDVVAVPIVPGAGAVTELAGAYSRGSRVFNAIGNIEGASKAASEAADIPGAIIRALPDPIAWAAKKAGLLDAPGDIRLITARALTDLYEQGGEVAAKLPKPFKETVGNALRVLDDAVAGKTKAMVSKTLLRNIQNVINGDLILIERLGLSNIKSPAALVETVLGDIDARAAVKRSMIAEEAINHTIKHFKDEGVGSLFMITPRVAVTSADEAKSIMTEVADDPIMKMAKDAAKKSNPVALTRLRDWVSTRDVLSSLADGSSEIEAGIKAALGTSGEAVKPLDNATVRLIADAVANDIALANPHVKALGPQAIKSLGGRAVDALLTPHEMRPTAITNAVTKIVDYFKGGQSLPALSPTVQSIINEVQQTVAATGSLIQRELIARVKAGAPNRAQALEDMITSIAGVGGLEYHNALGKMVPIAETIESMVVFNRPSSFSGSRILAPLRTTLNHLKDPAVDNIIRTARVSLQTNLAKAAKGIDNMTYKVAIETYLADVTAKLKAVKLDDKITVVSADSINEIMVAIVVDNKIKDVLQKGINTILDEHKLAIPKGLYDDALKAVEQAKTPSVERIRLSMYAESKGGNLPMVNPSDWENIIDRSMTAGIAKLMSEGRYSGLNSFIAEYKKISDEDFLSSVLKRAEKKADVNLDALKASMKLKDGQGKAAALLDALRDNQPMLRLYYAAEDAAREALKAQGIDRILTSSESVRLLNDVKQAFDDPSKLVPEARALIEALRETGYDQGKLWDYVRSDPNAWSLMNVVTDAFNGLKKTQYFFMLYARTRFHGVNILTAPFIIASTIGAKWSTSAMNYFTDGLMVGARIGDLEVAGGRLLHNTLDGVGNGVIVTSNAGKKYTLNDLADLAMKGGITRTETGMGGASSLIKPLSDLLEADAAKGLVKLPVWATAFVNMPAEFAALMDRTWRSSVLIAALKEGRTEMEAVALAREALFDYGRMTAFEQRYIANWFMYYSFTRSSIANVLWNIFNNPSRVANQIKATKGMPWLAGEGKPGGDDKGKGEWQRSIFYESGYMQARPWLGSNLEKVGKGSYGVYGPPLPLVDSYIFLAKIVGSALDLASMGYFETPISKDLDPGDYAMERMNPIAGNILSDRTQKMYGRGYIDPRHIAALKAAGMWDTFTEQIGQPSTRVAQPGETAWLVDQAGQPLTYTFEGDSAAIGRYIRLINITSALGMPLFISDWAPVLTDLPTVSPVETGVELQHGLNAARLVGAATWSKQDLPLEVLERNAKAAESKLKRVEK